MTKRHIGYNEIIELCEMSLQIDIVGWKNEIEDLKKVIETYKTSFEVFGDNENDFDLFMQANGTLKILSGKKAVSTLEYQIKFNQTKIKEWEDRIKAGMYKNIV